VIVAIWYYGFPTKLGIETYSQTVNITRELLTSLHDQAEDYDELTDANQEDEGDSQINTFNANNEEVQQEKLIGTASQHQPELDQKKIKRINICPDKFGKSSKTSFVSKPSVSQESESFSYVPMTKQSHPHVKEQVAPSVFEFPKSVKPAKSNTNAVRSMHKSMKARRME